MTEAILWAQQVSLFVRVKWLGTTKKANQARRQTWVARSHRVLTRQTWSGTTKSKTRNRVNFLIYSYLLITNCKGTDNSSLPKVVALVNTVALVTAQFWVPYARHTNSSMVALQYLSVSHEGWVNRAFKSLEYYLSRYLLLLLAPPRSFILLYGSNC